MTPITFPVPAIKFGKSDARLLKDIVFMAHGGDHPDFNNEDWADIDAIEAALDEFLA